MRAAVEAKRGDGKVYGRIVNTVSGAGLLGNFGQSNYSTAKADQGFLLPRRPAHPGSARLNLQMKYKPMPRYADGVIVPYAGPNADAAVGRMFIQPWVETADGRRVMLDDELGRSFAVIGIHVDLATVLGAEAAAWWRDLGARLVHVLAPRSGQHPDPVAGVTRVEDVDGAFRDWLLRRPGDCLLVLRPDRYVAAVCGRDGLDQVTSRLRAILAGSA